MNYHFRYLTNEDLDELYAHAESAKWLIPFYASRQNNHAVESNHAYIAISENQDIKFFNFPEDFSRNEINDWFVYFDKQKGLMIIQYRFGDSFNYFAILFCSEQLKPIQDQVISNILDAFIQGGYSLTGESDDFMDCDRKNRIEFIYAQANDKGRF